VKTGPSKLKKGNADTTIPTMLASACVSTMELSKQFMSPMLHWCIKVTSRLCQEVETVSAYMAHRFVNELDRVMSELQINSLPDWHNDPSYAMTWQSLPDWSTGSHDLTLLGFHAGMVGEARIYTFTARHDLFCPPMTLPNAVNFEQRFFVVSHALSSWLARDFRPSLEQRLKCLAYLLSYVLAPESVAFQTSVWQLVVGVSGRLLHEERYLEAAHLLKVALSATSSPGSLWRSPVQSSQLRIDHPNSLLACLKVKLQQSSSEERSQLVIDVEQLANSKKTYIIQDDVSEKLLQHGTVLVREAVTTREKRLVV
jgi:hypothetical protein